MEQPSLFGFPPWKPGSPTYRVPLVRLQMIRERQARFDAVPVINSPEDSAGILTRVIGNADRELLVVLCLDVHRRVTAINGAAVGSLGGVDTAPREIFKAAVLANSAAIILGHNHPSGDPRPSREDIATTHHLWQVGEILGIPLADHIILGATSWVSLAELGLLEPPKKP